MRKKLYILIAIIFLTIFLSFVLVFCRHKFVEAQSSGVEFIFSKEDYLFELIKASLFIISACFIGYIAWRLLRKWQNDKILFLIILNLVGTIYFGYKVLNQVYKTWHYNKFQANIDYNESLTKRNGNYLDSCILMVQQDIQKTGLTANDYRVSYYEYDNELTTVPRDTSNKFYSFDIFYYITKEDLKKLRAASYLIHFDGRMKKLYDLDTNDEKAKKQIEALKRNLKKLKNVLQEFPDSTSNQFDELKNKLKRLE